MPADCSTLVSMPRLGSIRWQEKRSVHRVFDVKGGRHFSVFPVFLDWSVGRTQLHQSSTCDRASVHRLWVWAITQALSSECHPRGTNLRSQWFKNHHPQELNSSAVGSYISSEQRWVNHEVNEACSSEPLLAPVPSKSQGGPRAVVKTERTLWSLPLTVSSACLLPVENFNQRISLIRKVRDAETKENSLRRLNNNNIVIKHSQGLLVLSPEL